MIGYSLPYIEELFIFREEGEAKMDFQKFKDELIEYSKTIGIDQIGFTSADPFQVLKKRLIDQQNLNFASGFEEPDLDKRTNPRSLMSEAQSIIAIAVAYPSKLKNAPKSKAGDRRGIFSRSSWGLDYHYVVRDRLKKLESFILERMPDSRLSSMVDTGELVDRAVAERAGIGWSGKNCSILNEEFGSYMYLGEMITSIPFPPDTPMEDLCGTCTKCLDACPTGALVQGGQINAKRCISFLTQTKDMIPDKFRDKMGNRVYGCDSCQTSCPYNRRIDFHNHPECESDPELAKPQLTALLTLSNRQFKEKFGSVSGSWRGKMPIQRNAIIALAHFKDSESVAPIKELLQKDPRPVIRGTAAWALGKIGGQDAVNVLKDCLSEETDQIVLDEINNALERLMLPE